MLWTGSFFHSSVKHKSNILFLDAKRKSTYLLKEAKFSIECKLFQAALQGEVTISCDQDLTLLYTRRPSSGERCQENSEKTHRMHCKMLAVCYRPVNGQERTMAKGTNTEHNTPIRWRWPMAIETIVRIPNLDRFYIILFQKASRPLPRRVFLCLDDHQPDWVTSYREDSPFSEILPLNSDLVRFRVSGTRFRKLSVNDILKRFSMSNLLPNPSPISLDNNWSFVVPVLGFTSYWLWEWGINLLSLILLTIYLTVG